MVTLTSLNKGQHNIPPWKRAINQRNTIAGNADDDHVSKKSSGLYKSLYGLFISLF